MVSRSPLYRLVVMAMALLTWSLGVGLAHASPACPEMRFDILTPGLASTPYIILTAGGKTGPWLVDFGATATSIYADAWKSSGPESQSPSFAFDFPGADTRPRQLPAIAGDSHRPGVGSPLGILGTDILKTTTTELHFEDSNAPFLLFLNPACEQDSRGRQTDRHVGQADYFSAHPETHGANRPNVPVVFIELEERSTDRTQPYLSNPTRSPKTWAQVDTGYADSYWPHAIDINEPYLEQLKAAVPSLALAGLVSIGGCGYEDSLREVYVAPGWRLNIVPDWPEPVIPFDSFYLIVKPRTTRCGGIGPMPVPAAQLGASFLRAFGTTRFVPSKPELRISLPERD